MTSDEARKREIERVKAPVDIALLDDIARGIRKITKHLEETTPEGVDVPLETKIVTSIKPEITDIAHQPLRSVYFLNKGPNTVYYLINDDPTETALEDRENITVTRPRRTIVKITLRTRSGESATVKMVGSY